MDCEQPKKYSFSMGNLFFVLGLVLILSIGNRVNLNELALKLSEIFITFPFVLLAIFLFSYITYFFFKLTNKKVFIVFFLFLFVFVLKVYLHQKL